MHKTREEIDALNDWRRIQNHKESIADILTGAALAAMKERGGYRLWSNDRFREELYLLIERAL